MKILIALLLVCAPLSAAKLTSINLIDSNGFTENVRAKDRLAQYSRVNFYNTQPYKKVVRTYAPDSYGQTLTYITTYHDNGQVHQSLPVLSGRASGVYQEWHANGQKKLVATVIGGKPDVDLEAIQSYLFDGESEVYDEAGNLSAKICYQSGQLHGNSTYHYPSGQIEQVVPFQNGNKHGLVRLYSAEGVVEGEIEYANDLRDGKARGLTYEEEYAQGFLARGDYRDLEGRQIAKVRHGRGQRAVANTVVDYREGRPHGTVTNLDERGFVLRQWEVVEGSKRGEEIEYYPVSRFASPGVKPQPKLSIHWYQDEIQGVVKTWYPSGQLQSQREVSRNKKNGLSSAWYDDGALMLIEEYLDDKLVKGDYFAVGSHAPTSRVLNGIGLATLYDERGRLLKRVNYLDGQPIQ